MRAQSERGDVLARWNQRIGSIWLKLPVSEMHFVQKEKQGGYVPSWYDEQDDERVREEDFSELLRYVKVAVDDENPLKSVAQAMSMLVYFVSYGMSSIGSFAALAVAGGGWLAGMDSTVVSLLAHVLQSISNRAGVSPAYHERPTGACTHWPGMARCLATEGGSDARLSMESSE